MNANGPLTPKEFAAEVFDGKRSARWVRSQIRLFLRTKGQSGIAVISRSKPWLIPRSEANRHASPLLFIRRNRAA